MTRRFQAGETTIYRDLQATCRKMGATGLRVNSQFDVLKGSGQSEIIFDCGGRRYSFRCEKYSHPLDNLRAAQLTIAHLYAAMEEYGVLRTKDDLEREAARFFGPFEALPDDSALLLLTDGSTAEWWEVLGLKREEATKAAITNAYRALSRLHHPDVGGNPEDFKRLRRAYEQGVASLS